MSRYLHHEDRIEAEDRLGEVDFADYDEDPAEAWEVDGEPDADDWRSWEHEPDIAADRAVERGGA